MMDGGWSAAEKLWLQIRYELGDSIPWALRVGRSVGTKMLPGLPFDRV